MTDMANWITNIQPSAGSGNATVTVSMQNNSGAQRTATIRVKGQGVPDKTFTLTQKAIQLYPVTIYGNSFTVGEYTGATSPDGAMNNSQQINVYSTTQTLNLGSRLFLDSFANNEFEVTEMSWFRIDSGPFVARIDIVGYVLEVVDTSQTLSVATPSAWGVNGGSKTISVTSNTSWQVTNSPSWITISNGSGAGNGSFTATASSNDGTDTDERNGTITVRTSDGYRNVQVSIRQEGTYQEDLVYPNIIQTGVIGGYEYFSIGTTKSWTINLPSTLPFGFEVMPMSGTGNYNNVRITVPQNHFSNPVMHSFDVNIGGTLHNVIVQQAGAE